MGRDGFFHRRTVDRPDDDLGGVDRILVERESCSGLFGDAGQLAPARVAGSDDDRVAGLCEPGVARVRPMIPVPTTATVMLMVLPLAEREFSDAPPQRRLPM